jgi:hypothetical protein
MVIEQLFCLQHLIHRFYAYLAIKMVQCRCAFMILLCIRTCNLKRISWFRLGLHAPSEPNGMDHLVVGTICSSREEDACKFAVFYCCNLT